MITNEIKDLIIKRIEEGGFANQWLFLTIIGDSDCSLLLSRREIDLLPEYNVGWTYYSDLFLFNAKELDEIRSFFLEELAKFPRLDEGLVHFQGGVLIDTKSFTLKLRGCLRLYIEKGDDLIFELAKIYDSKFRAKAIWSSYVLISKFKLIDELSSTIQMNNFEIHGVSDLDFNLHENHKEVGMDVEVSFKI